MMLDSRGEAAAATRLMSAIERVTGEAKVVPPDLGGNATTRQVTDAVLSAISGGND